MAGDQAHRLAAAETADADNADANAHGSVLPGFGQILGFRQKKTPEAEGCGGSGTRVGPFRGAYDEAITRGRTPIDAQPEEPPLGGSDVGVDRKGSGS
ncbi:hypothetical protein [Bosea sp. ASV33]|uniref:hypothetical protein n=1 Tax=Bosea sp. ASV33 TaxID=2795106 RepID=UPI0018EAE796|nr:hypothetical protein [Bosea sp. ASV33]